MPHQDWYAVRSIFRSDRPVEGKPSRIFEERVVIFQASSHAEALAKGEAEAKQYAKDWPQPKMLDHLVAFGIGEDELREGEEVWSCLRQSPVSDGEFLDQIYDGELLGLRHAERGE